MIIGVPKEIKDQEFRVALLPSAAYQLIKRGHEVVVERNAGAGSGYPDADYAQAGATVSVWRMRFHSLNPHISTIASLAPER